MRRRAARIGLAVVAATAAPGCSSSFFAPEPASRQGEEIFDLYRWFTAAAAGVGAFVVALLFYVVVRFRRRNDEIPRQNPYNVPIEVAYTVTPLLIVAVLFFFSVRTEQSVSGVVEDPDHVVEVVGFQWQWQFTYPDDGIVVTGTPDQELPELVLPAERTTRLVLSTTDVNHNFWVPSFLTKRDLIQGVDNEIDVTPTRTGSYDGVCAEFCGLDHVRMRFVVRVVEPDEFDAWRTEAGT